jgi:hypothetical protein
VRRNKKRVVNNIICKTNKCVLIINGLTVCAYLLNWYIRRSERYIRQWCDIFLQFRLHNQTNIIIFVANENTIFDG